MRRLGAHQLLLMWRRRDSALGLKSIVDHLENERDWHGPVNLRAIDEESWGLAYPKLDTRTDTCILFSGVLLLYAGLQRGRINMECMTFVRYYRIELLLGFD